MYLDAARGRAGARARRARTRRRRAAPRVRAHRRGRDGPPRRARVDRACSAPTTALGALVWLLVYRLWLGSWACASRTAARRGEPRGPRAGRRALRDRACGLSIVDVVLGACMQARHLIVALAAGRPDPGASRREPSRPRSSRAGRGRGRARAGGSSRSPDTLVERGERHRGRRRSSAGTHAIGLLPPRPLARAPRELLDAAYEKYPNHKARLARERQALRRLRALSTWAICAGQARRAAAAPGRGRAAQRPLHRREPADDVDGRHRARGRRPGGGAHAHPRGDGPVVADAASSSSTGRRWSGPSRSSSTRGDGARACEILERDRRALGAELPPPSAVLARDDRVRPRAGPPRVGARPRRPRGAPRASGRPRASRGASSGRACPGRRLSRAWSSRPPRTPRADREGRAGGPGAGHPPLHPGRHEPLRVGGPAPPRAPRRGRGGRKARSRGRGSAWAPRGSWRRRATRGCSCRAAGLRGAQGRRARRPARRSERRSIRRGSGSRSAARAPGRPRLARTSRARPASGSFVKSTQREASSISARGSAFPSRCPSSRRACSRVSSGEAFARSTSAPNAAVTRDAISPCARTKSPRATTMAVGNARPGQRSRSSMRRTAPTSRTSRVAQGSGSHAPSSTPRRTSVRIVAASSACTVTSPPRSEGS